MSSAMFSWIGCFQDIFGPANRLEWNVEDDAVVLKNKDDGFYGHFDLHIHFFFFFWGNYNFWLFPCCGG